MPVSKALNVARYGLFGFCNFRSLKNFFLIFSCFCNHTRIDLFLFA